MHPDCVKFRCSVNDDCRWCGTDAAWPGDHYRPPIRTPGNWEGHQFDIQLKEFGLQVDEEPVRVPGGHQHIKTPDGYVHPI